MAEQKKRAERGTMKKVLRYIKKYWFFVLMSLAFAAATVALTLHAKQPKRGMAAFDKGFLEVYEYPRAQEAVLTWTEDGRREVIREGSTAGALGYEIRDMERAVAGERRTEGWS